MSEIPEDIMAAAREAFRGGVGYPSDTPIADSALVIYIASAILAERERCAKIAENDVPEGFSYGPGMGIAAAIRNPKP